MTDRAIELIIIEPSYNTAEEYVSSLRNAGMAIHPTRVDGMAEIGNLLESSSPDLILCSADLERTEFEKCLDLCVRSHPGSSVIVLYQEQAPEVLLQALRSGARDVVSKNDPEHLQLVVKREFGDLLVRLELEQLKQQLVESESRCSALIDNSRDAIAYIHEGMHVRANSVYLEMFGYQDQEDLLGMPILDMIATEDLSRFKKSLRSVESGQGELEIMCKKGDGKTFKAVLEFSPSAVDGEPCTEIIIRDRSSDEQLERKLQMASDYDSQTGLLNKPFFMRQLENEFAEHKRTGESLAIMYMAIDDFQKIRGDIGIAASDSLLQELSKILSGVVSPGIVLSRFGDHSFCLLSDTIDSAKQLAENVHRAVKEHIFQSTNSLVEPRCNIGIAGLSETIPGCQEFVNIAYQACRAARSDETNGTYVHEEHQPAQAAGNPEASESSELIQDALENDRFKLAYQPIVSLDGESREIYSVLTRLIDANGEELLPDHFMAIASRGDCMTAIDRWAIDHALDELGSQRAEGRKVVFFISLSSQTIQDKSFLLWLCDCLREKNIKGSWLTFQMKEADLRAHLTEAKVLIEGLKMVNCKIAMDQYGLMPKSATLMKHLPVDFIKFDSSLVDGIAGNQEMQEKLTAMNTEIKGRDIKTIIVGVEDANSLAILWTVGVNYIQGYFLQEPSETIDFEFTGTHFS